MTISGTPLPLRDGADIPAAIVDQAPFAPSIKPYTATSTTSQANLSSSSIYTFEVQPYMAWQKGARVRAISSPSASWIEGVVVSYVGTALTFRTDRSFITAAGPYTDWTITITGEAEIEKQIVCSGEVLNATLVESNFLGTATFTLKSLFSGLDPSPENPVIFQAPSGATRVIDSPLSLTIPYLATLNVAAGQPFRLWFILIDDVGYDAHLGVGQTRNPGDNSIAAFQGQASITTQRPPGNASGVFYSDKVMTGQSYIVLGFADYDNGLATPGVWNVSPDRFVFYATGNPLPGDVIQILFTVTGAVNYTSVAMPIDNTVPVFPGAALFGVDVTPLSRSSVFTIEAQAAMHSDTQAFTICIFESSNANALAACWQEPGRSAVQLRAQKFLGNRTPTHFMVMGGREFGGVLTVNGVNMSTGYYGGAFNSFIRVVERMT